MLKNSCSQLYNQRDQLITKWGKDQTGLIEYLINHQGFRGNTNWDFVPKYAFFGSSVLFGIGVEYSKILVSQFENSHNYGLAGDYLNIDSVQNLEAFVNSEYYNSNVNIIFFWIERPGIESIPELYNRVELLEHKNILHVSQGQQYPKLINLMPHVDLDVSETHPGPKTHLIWAKTIKLLLNNDRTINSN